MNQPRLIHVSPRVVALISHASPEQRVKAAFRVCMTAVKRTELKDDRVMRALELIGRGEVADGAFSAEVSNLVQELDEVAWLLQDKVEAGTAGELEYTNAFSKARAAAALALACRPEDLLLESLYEAYHAIGDPDDFIRAVDRSQQGC